MKLHNYRLLVLVFIIGILVNPLSSVPKYIIFSNFDDTYINTAYFDNFKNYDGLTDYAPNLIKAPFDANTLSQYNLTDFDMAIFPMGDAKLSSKAGSTSVIAEIKKMIAAGKNVLVTGRQMVYQALDPSGSDKNPDVVDFLTNTMGIQWIGKKLVSSFDGTTLTWWSYVIHGHDPDPVGKSVRKGCNMKYNNGDPLANYLSLDVFKSKDPNTYFPVEHFIYSDAYERNDTIVAIRAEVGQSRIVLYSMGFEAFAGEIPRGSLLHRCMVYCLGNIKPDGPNIQFDPLAIDFERVPLDSMRIIDVEIKSIGKDPLVITETNFFDDGEGTFTIVSGEIKKGSKSVTLKNGEFYAMKIGFKPTEKKQYTGTFSVYSNSMTGNIKDINLQGIGGQDNNGSKISTNYGTSIDFGKVEKAKSKTIDLKIYNDGDKELLVQTFKMDLTQKDADRFTFAQVLNTPFFVKPRDSVTVKVKFAATVAEERVYTGKIKVDCDAVNNPSFFIDLSGEIYTPSGVVDNELNSSDGKFKMSVSPNPASSEFVINYNLLSNDGTDLNLRLADINGNLIEKLDNNNLSSGTIKYNTSNISNGVYFIIAEYRGISYYLNVIVNK